MKSKKYLFYVLKSDISPNEIRYVGVTTTSLARRFTQHHYCAKHPEKRGLPVHKWMHSVYEKGGKINIEQIDQCSELEWEKREKFLIQKYRDLGYDLLNIDEGGKGVITEEKRSKDSITRSAEKHRKPITAYNLDGSKYKDFSSLTEAANFCNGKINNIESVLSGNSKSAYGYMWKYKSENEFIDKYKKEQIGTKIYQFDLEGKFIREFESKKEVLNFFNVDSYRALTNAIKNKTEYKKYFWSLDPIIDITTYISPFKYKITKDNKVIKVMEQKEVAEIIGSCKATICTKLKNNTSFIYNGYLIESI